MHAAQALKPRLAVLSPRQSALPRQVTPLPRWAVLVPSQEGMQMLNPWLTVLLPRHLGLVLPRQVPLGLPGILPQRENTLEDLKLQWVINLSSKSLTQAQRSLLAKGPNFVVTLRHPPNLEHITAIESVCSELGQQDAEELRADINRVLRSSHPTPNLTKAQIQALRELKGIGIG